MSAYVFLAQTLAVFVLLQCNDKTGNAYIRTGLAVDYAATQIISNFLSYGLMFGNMKFLMSGAMSCNVALLIYIFRMKVMRLPTEEENPNFRSPVKKFLYVLFFYLSTSWFVQDLIDRFVVLNYSSDATNSYHIDVILTMFHLKLPNFYSMLTYYRENVHDLVTVGTMRLYIVVFLFKNLSIYIAIKFYDMLHQKYQKINEDVHEMQERAKNYVIEDFLETNRITMKDLSDPKTEKRIQENLELLEQCNYDYELYKLEKRSLKIDTKAEKENFLNDIKKLKNQIQKVEKTQKVDKNLKVEKNLKIEKVLKVEKSRLNKVEDKKQEQSEDTEDELLREKKPSKHESKSRGSNNDSETFSEDSIYHIQPFYTFALLQTFFMFFVALKFVVTPFFCLISATLPSRSWFHKTSSVYWVFYMFLVLCTFNYPGFKNIKTQFQIKKEFRNPELENLIHWIDKTESNAVFGAPIEVAAHILLSCKRPIVNHPLIEYPDMIDRTKSLYSIFSKRLPTEIYNNLVKLRVQFVVVSYDSCFLGSSEGLRLIDIFDYLDPDNYDKKAFCVSLFQNNNPTFLKVFENVKYIVIQIFSQSIQLELKKNNVLELNM